MEINKNFLTGFVALVITTGLFAQQNKSPEAVIEAWQKMWNTYDLEQVEQLFVTDQSVTYFSSEYAGLIIGTEAVRNHHEKFGFIRGGKKSGNKLWLSDARYDLANTTCLVTATWYFQRETSEQRQAGPVTFLLVKKNDGWRIQHAHFSNNP
ncbi:MAG: nuclear transport factor 2 family protein [Flammeovirgaceae bacterium]|nr:MAG: nuclear transport factor 2 family protein [Flammeovirgaceae bacterium]